MWHLPVPLPVLDTPLVRLGIRSEILVCWAVLSSSVSCELNILTHLFEHCHLIDGKINKNGTVMEAPTA